MEESNEELNNSKEEVKEQSGGEAYKTIQLSGMYETGFWITHHT